MLIDNRRLQMNQFQSTYESDQSAAYALLGNATTALNECGVNFVVVGGWVPFLFHSHRFGHPGTFDVDILLHSESLEDGSFDLAAEKLLGEGYLRAVKNRFQAHRVIRVGDEDLVFHVDFLNESNQGEQLNIVGGRGRIQSIYTPAMEAVFKYDSFRFHNTLPNVRFPSVETFLASKAAGTLVKKRPRDAFDAFISVSDQDPLEFAMRWMDFQSDGLFVDANMAFVKALDEGDAIPKIRAQLDELGSKTSPSDADILRAFSFLVR
jgi:hypothetical protein